MKDIVLTTFTDLGLSQSLIAALTKAGFETPTPIQHKAIPPQLAGKDILGIAQTGSGKTAAFALPILAGLAKMEGRIEPRSTRALILAPTRELAVQIEESFRKFAGTMRLSTVLVLGGVSRHNQVLKLAKGVDVTIATPGRLKDLLDDKKLRLDFTKWLVLDEADRMLDMGFIKPVKEIAAAIGSRRQTALFSATMAPEIAQLAAGLLKDPVRVEATPPATTVAIIEQSVIFTATAGKRAKLNELLADETMGKVIVFARTKHGADRVTKNLALDGHTAAAIHGNKSQNARQAALKGFADGKVRILVATDIAARGIDVPNISHVINYELPDDPENYVHRIGRTGRNGASGIAITLCDGPERSKLRDVERLIRRTLPWTGETNPSDRGPKSPAPKRPEQKRSYNGNANARSHQGRPSDAARGDGKKAWWEKDAKPAAAAPKGTAGKVKPRWNKDQKDGARARRTDGDRPRTERAAS